MSGPEYNPADDVQPTKEEWEAMEMERRRDKINEMADELCRGKRYAAADAHMSAGIVVEEITGRAAPDRNYYSFLCGWDAAMEIDREELNEELQKLHGIIHDLCTRMAIERCPKCNGESVVWDSGDCELCKHPGCQQGWIDRPAKRDWRTGLSVKTKSRNHPMYYERGIVAAVHPSGHGGLVDKDGVLEIKLVGGSVILGRADEWVTA